MEPKQTRIFLIMIIALISSLMFNKWQAEHQVEVELTKQVNYEYEKENPNTQDYNVPSLKKEEYSKKLPTSSTDNLIEIETNLIKAKIDPKGGDLVNLELSRYSKSSEEKTIGYPLFAQTAERYFYAQSGLMGKQGPDSNSGGRAEYQLQNQEQLKNNYNTETKVSLIASLKNNIIVTKQYIFYPDSYNIKVSYTIENHSNEAYEGQMYGRLKMQNKESSSTWQNLSIRTFTGIATTTPNKPYKKINFSDVKSKPFRKQVSGGWAAIIEHYFLGAWIPPSNQENLYITETFNNNVYGISFVGELINVLPGEKKSTFAYLYAGPEETEILASLAPNLELTVDYGMFWIVCQPIFWLLKNIHNIIGNWGWSIILTTLVIKMMFYGLSAKSYRSMANMKKLQPKLEELKKRYGENKQEFGNAVMQMYRKEKVNPFSGCLPIIVQIPIFLSLYYVLLNSVELRQAPFIFWINDLSSKDPFYVLPLMMGASMFLQQKLSPPTMQDPAMAKAMTFMPIFFTALFLNFPSGLVLYWVVNTMLSVLQQWYITKKI